MSKYNPFFGWRGVVGVVVLLAGCATEQPSGMPQNNNQGITPTEQRIPTRYPRLTTPWTAMITPQTGEVGPLMSRGAAVADARHVLVDDQEFFVGRGEKYVSGPVELAAFSAYSTLQYDMQPIGTINGTGYRYRWVVQQGISVP